MTCEFLKRTSWSSFSGENSMSKVQTEEVGTTETKEMQGLDKNGRD